MSSRSVLVASRSVRYLRNNVGEGLRTSLVGRWSKMWLPFVVYLLVALGVALSSMDLFPVSLPSFWKVLLLPPVLVVFPSLLEEVFFRGVLLPRRLADAQPFERFAAVTVSTAIFTVWHPINHWLLSFTDTSLFVEPAFLVIVVALGYACAYAYLRTGSLWAPIFIHWATVVMWNLFFGR